MRACQKKHHGSLPKKTMRACQSSLNLSVGASKGLWEQPKLPSSGSCWFFMALVVFEPGSQDLALCKGLHQCISAYSESRSAKRLCLYCRAAVFWRFQVFQFYNFFVQWKNATWKLERQSLPAIPKSKTRLFNDNFNFCWFNQDFWQTNDNHWWLKYCVHKNEHWWAKIPRKVPWFIFSDICKIWPYYKCNES